MRNKKIGITDDVKSEDRVMILHDGVDLKRPPSLFFYRGSDDDKKVVVIT